MSRARVWNNHSQWQREAIAKEGPLHNEELFHLREAVIQGKASSRERKFVQRLRDTVDEELVGPIETFVSAAHREPDFTEELDRTDEVAEAEVDVETPSPAAESTRQPGSPNNWRNLSRIAKRSMPPKSCLVDKTSFEMSRVRRTIDAENGCGFAEVLPFQPSLRH